MTVTQPAPIAANPPGTKLRSPTHPADRTEKVLFVIGAFRSGTSLLYSLLNRHPDVALMYECDVLKVAGPQAGADWRERLDLWNGSLKRHSLPLGKVSAPEDIQGRALSLYRAYGRSRHARVIGEKSPYYADMLPRLIRWFPEAHYLILWRDPEDIVASVAHAGKTNRFFSKPWMKLRALMDWDQLNADVARLRSSPLRLHEIHYQDLSTHPERVLEGIWNFLGVAHVTGLCDQAPDLSAMPEGLHHQNVSKPVGRRTASMRPAPPLPSGKLSRYRDQLSSQGIRRLLLRFRIERLADHACYRALRLRDASLVGLFRLAPIAVLKTHRADHPI